jgi:hypothetical protein
MIYKLADGYESSYTPLDLEEKIIESKTICYCSNFDMNINDWLNEYENLEIFKIIIKMNLGTPFNLKLILIGVMRLEYFREAIQETVTTDKRKKRDDHLFTVICNFYLVNYYSPATQGMVSHKTPMTWHSEYV